MCDAWGQTHSVSDNHPGEEKGRWQEFILVAQHMKLAGLSGDRQKSSLSLVAIKSRGRLLCLQLHLCRLVQILYFNLLTRTRVVFAEQTQKQGVLSALSHMVESKVAERNRDNSEPTSENFLPRLFLTPYSLHKGFQLKYSESRLPITSSRQLQKTASRLATESFLNTIYFGSKLRLKFNNAINFFKRA